MAGKPIGTLFVELDLDPSRYMKGQQTLLRESKSGAEILEKNFKNLGIKSNATFDLMRSQAEKSLEAIKKSGKATADDLVRAEKAKADKIRQINEEQYGHQKTIIENLKEHWKGYAVAATAAVYSIVAVGTKAVVASMEQEKAQIALGAALRASGGYTDELMGKYTKFASGIQKVTTYGDEQVLKLMALQKNLGVTSDRLEEATKMSIGLAAATGRDVDSMAMYIALAEQGEFTMLRRYIPALRSTTDKTEQLKIITEFAARGFLVAQENAKTFSGGLDQLKNLYGDVFERIGDVVVKNQALLDLMETGKRTLLEWAENIGLWVEANDELIAQKTYEAIDNIGAAFRGATSAVLAIADAYDKASKSLRVMRLLMGMPLPGDYEFGAPKSTYPAGGKIGPRTKGYDIYKPPLPLEIVSTPPSAVAPFDDAWLKTYLDSTKKAIEADRLRSQSIGEVAILQNKYETENYQSTVEHGDAWLKKWLSVVDTRTESNRVMNENIGKLAVLDVDDNKKLASEKAKAYGKMYGDMKGDAANYYNYQLDALDEQRRNYETLVGKNAVTDAWYARKKKDLDRELTLSSNDFFGGIKIGYERAQESAVTFARVGQSTFESFTAETTNMLSDNFFNLFTGNMDKLSLDWESMWQGMARTASDKLAQIATDKALEVAVTGVDWLGSAMGWWAAGSWDIKKDQIAQLHKGEMVVPADEASRIRSASESGSNAALGESWGGSKSFPPGSYGAQVEQSIQDSLLSSARKFGLNKIAGLIATGQIVATVNPMGMLGTFAAAAISGLYSAYTAYRDFKTIYGDIDMDWGASSLSKAMPYGKISFDDMTKNFSMWGLGTYNPRDWGEGGGGEGGGLGLGDFGGVDSMGRESGVGYAHKGAKLNLRNDEGFFVGQKGEEVVTEKNLKILKQLVAATSTGRTGGPLVYIGGNLIADKQTFNDFVEKIDVAINKNSKRVYQ